MILIPVTVASEPAAVQIAPTVPVKLLRNTNALYCLENFVFEVTKILRFSKGNKDGCVQRCGASVVVASS